MIVVIQKYEWLPQLAFGKERYSLTLLINYVVDWTIDHEWQ